MKENILTDGHCLLPYTCKRCIILNFKQFDKLNFDGLAGKRQKHQNFPPSKFCTIRYLLELTFGILPLTNQSQSAKFEIGSVEIYVGGAAAKLLDLIFMDSCHLQSRLSPPAV